jgi:hypothetical protein
VKCGRLGSPLDAATKQARSFIYLLKLSITRDFLAATRELTPSINRSLQYTRTIGTSLCNTFLLSGNYTSSHRSTHLQQPSPPDPLIPFPPLVNNQRPIMAAPSCLICQEEFNNKLYYSAPVNGDADRKVCVICLTTMMTRVINNDDEYPIRLQHPGDLRPLDLPYYFDDAFIEQYKLKEIEHNTFPNDRVYCECMKFIG